jgi:hypothetical protein
LIFDVNTFRSLGLPLGGARPSLFEIFIPTTVLGALAGPGQSNIALMVSAATLPQARVTSIDVYYQGRAYPQVGERVFNPWQIRCYVDEDFGLRDFFESWSNMMNTFEGNEALNTSESLATNGGYMLDGVLARQWAKTGDLLRSYTFFGMYPELVSDIELNWEQGNRIETFDVQLRYAYWLPSGSATDGQQNSPASYLNQTGVTSTTTTTTTAGVPGSQAGRSGSPIVTQIGNQNTSVG